MDKALILIISIYLALCNAAIVCWSFISVTPDLCHVKEFCDCQISMLLFNTGGTLCVENKKSDLFFLPCRMKGVYHVKQVMI